MLEAVGVEAVIDNTLNGVGKKYDFNASNPLLNTLQVCSSAAGDEGDNSRPHQGE